METDVVGRLMARNEELVRANVRLQREVEALQTVDGGMFLAENTKLHSENSDLLERVNREVNRLREARTETESFRRGMADYREECAGLRAQAERQAAHIAALEEKLKWRKAEVMRPVPASPEAVSEPRYIARKTDAGYETFDTKDEVVMNTWRIDHVSEAKAREYAKYAENYANALNLREEVSQ